MSCRSWRFCARLMALTTSSAVVDASSLPTRFEFSLCTPFVPAAAAPFLRRPLAFPPPRPLRLATASGWRDVALLFEDAPPLLLFLFCFLARSAAFRRDRFDAGLASGLASTSAAVIRGGPAPAPLPSLNGQLMGPAGRRSPGAAAAVRRRPPGPASMSDETRGAHRWARSRAAAATSRTRPRPVGVPRRVRPVVRPAVPSGVLSAASWRSGSGLGVSPLNILARPPTEMRKWMQNEGFNDLLQTSGSVDLPSTKHFLLLPLHNSTILR
mmetsp:Transcript_27741/g.62184  ORF Transcript_27741/g.62184 Transcript_27741/m.62184 type:complete len:269 (-) Transcript_27741:9-815(-)